MLTVTEAKVLQANLHPRSLRTVLFTQCNEQKTLLTYHPGTFAIPRQVHNASREVIDAHSPQLHQIKPYCSGSG